MQNARGWLQGIQYFRAIAVLEIIVLHVTLLVRLSDLTVFNFQKGLLVTIVGFTMFGVPHFLFISGVVLYHSQWGFFSVDLLQEEIQFSPPSLSGVVNLLLFLAICAVDPISCSLPAINVRFELELERVSNRACLRN